jgi:hypothetical protein
VRPRGICRIHRFLGILVLQNSYRRTHLELFPRALSPHALSDAAGHTAPAPDQSPFGPSVQRPASPLRRGPRDRQRTGRPAALVSMAPPGGVAQIAGSTAVPGRPAETGHLAADQGQHARGWPEPAIPPRPMPLECQIGPISPENPTRMPTPKNYACPIQLGVLKYVNHAIYRNVAVD